MQTSLIFLSKLHRVPSATVPFGNTLLLTLQSNSHGLLPVITESKHGDRHVIRVDSMTFGFHEKFPLNEFSS